MKRKPVMSEQAAFASALCAWIESQQPPAGVVGEVLTTLLGSIVGNIAPDANALARGVAAVCQDMADAASESYVEARKHRAAHD
jgi:hypothetical protein